MKKIRFTLALAGFIVPSLIASAQYAGAVLSYDPGVGFAAGFTNADAALGAPASGAAVTPFAPPFSKTQIVSIGAGGNITLQFNSPLTHDSSRPYGLDFILYANSFFVNSSSGVSGLFSHANSTLVQVSLDDSIWYTLNPALSPPVGQLFPTDGSGSPQIPVNPSLILGDFTGQNLAGIRSLYQGSAGGTGYDLAWAQDANGNSIALADINYIRLEVGSGVVDLDAVSVAPEPRIWAMFLPGLAIVGWRQRRPRRSSLQNFRPKNVPGTPLAKVPILNPILLCFLFTAATAAADTNVFTENFTTDPSANGWQIFGDTNLFHWDAINHNLAVTWDSSQPNSYFHHALPAPFTREDGFNLDFDLLLHDITNSGGTFEIAVGFLNLSNAVSPGFLRGTGFNTTNLVEFDYFLDPTYGPSLDVSENDSNGLFASIYVDLAQALATNTTYHISIRHAPGDPLVTSQIFLNNQLFGTLGGPYVQSGFSDYQVDTLSVSSYSDAGQDPDFGVGTIFAHGTVANFVVSVPVPIELIQGSFSGPVWQTQFKSLANYNYTLERSTNLQIWNAAAATTIGNNGTLILQDTNAIVPNAFYRVRAQK